MVDLHVQNDTGNTPNANSYEDEMFVTDYLTMTGREDDWVAADVQDQRKALVWAKDFIDLIYGNVLKGIKLTADQETEFPRDCAYDNAGRQITGIPLKVKKAVSEVALLKIQGVEFFTYVEANETTTTSATGAVKKEGFEIGPIKETTEYDSSGSTSVQTQLVSYFPIVEALMSEFVDNSNEVIS